MQWTHVRGNSFHQNVIGFMPWMLERGELYGVNGENPIASVDARDVADAMVACVLEGGHEGRTYELSGPAALAWPELAAEAGTALRRPVRYVELEPSQLRTCLLRRGWEPFPTNEWIRIFAAGSTYASGPCARVTDDVRRLTGAEPRPFADWAAGMMPAPAAAPVR